MHYINMGEVPDTIVFSHGLLMSGEPDRAVKHFQQALKLQEKAGKSDRMKDRELKDCGDKLKKLKGQLIGK